MSDREWQPIETAPKDGTRIVVWLDDEDFPCFASWRKRPADPTDPEDEDWEGFWLWEMDQGAEFHIVTHWQPAPSRQKEDAHV